MDCLRENEVHLFYAKADLFDCASAALAILAPDERSRYERFHFTEDKQEFLTARYLLRTLLARHYVPGVSPQNLKFVYEDRGKPQLCKSQNVRSVSFNVSHSKGTIALAFSGNKKLGVDLEFMGRKSNYVDIAEHAFSEFELCELRKLAAEERQKRFYQYWTLKEAYIKAEGAGLSMALDRFHFDLEKSQAIRVVRHDESDTEKWRFQLRTPFPGYQAAIAIHSDRDIEVTEKET